MIKIFSKHEALEKWNVFKRRKMAYWSLIFFIVSCFFSFTAEFWANSKPLYLKHHGESYFPVFKDYTAKDFGITDALAMDYRALKLEEGDAIIWPLVQWNPFESNKKVSEYPAPPSSSNIWGTDDRGRDVFARILYGLRYGITFAVAVWIITFIVGTLVGGVQGYFGGNIDIVGQRVTEILSTVPQFFLLIILVSIFQPTLTMLVIIMSVFGWIGISYYVRGEYLRNRRKEYVEAARAIGAKHPQIFFRHILPNSLTPIITYSPFVITSGIIALASLDYLGFGLAPPTPSWGELLNQAKANFTIAWWLAVYPSAALFIVLTMLNLIGEGVRDAFDPRRKS